MNLKLQFLYTINDGTYYQNKVVNITRICEVKRGYTRMFGKEKEEQPA
jgi:hypothetical protein